MDEKYANSIIDSTTNYVNTLQYLGTDRKKNLRDIHTLGIICNIYNWADWYEISETYKIKMQKLMDCIIMRNSELVLPTVIANTYYSNVSLPQTIWTWQRVYDNLLVTQQEDLIVDTLDVIPNPANLPASDLTGSMDENGYVNAIANFLVLSNVAWTATTTETWFSIVVGTAGSGNGNISIGYDTNNTDSVRGGTFTVSSANIDVIVTVNQTNLPS